MFFIRYPTHSDADSRIQETMKLEELSISEYSPPYRLKTKEVGVQHDSSPNPYRIMTAEVGIQYDLSDACLEEVVVEKLKRVSPRKSEKMTEKIDDAIRSTFSMSSDTHTQENMTEFICPPVLFRKTGEKRDPYGSLTLIENPKKSADYEPDDTCDAYVECGEKGKCKCRRIRGGEYYEYYESTKEKDYFTMYQQGKCVLPKGAVFHFTGAPNTMKREDVNDALVALGAKIEFLDYQRGSKEGWVRLSYKYEARIIIKKMIDKKKLNVAGAELVFRVLSGKDEKRYHKKAIDAIFQLQEKAKGLERKLKKAGYSYVTKNENKKK